MNIKITQISETHTYYYKLYKLKIVTKYCARSNICFGFGKQIGKKPIMNLLQKPKKLDTIFVEGRIRILSTWQSY